MTAVMRNDAPLGLAHLLDARAQADAARTAFIFLGGGTERSITAGQLDRYARGFAARLLTEVAPGDRALLLYEPGFAYVVALLGCAYAGIIPVPLFPPRVARTMPRVQAIARDSGAAVALATRQFLAWLAGSDEPSLPADIRWLAIEPDDDDLAAIADRQIGPQHSGDIALLQYTSGSTGTPKGVVLTHANLMANLAMICTAFRLTRDDLVVTWLPPYHDMGLIGGLLTSLHAGFPVVVSSPLAFLQRPLGWLKTISRFRATASPAPNFAYQLCVDKFTPERAGDLDLSSLRVAFVGAEPVRAATLDRFTATFAPYGFRRAAFAPCYGLAEATLLVSGGSGSGPVSVELSRTALAAGRIEPASGADSCTIVSSGPPAEGVEIGIFDPDHGTLVPPGEIGEICVRGPSIAAGYWNRPSETAATFRVFDGRGPFLCTGDLGYLADGELFVTGRRKEIIIIRGRNVYPRDVEEVAGNAHRITHPDGCVAFAIETPGGEGLAIVAEHPASAKEPEQREAAAAIRTAVTTDIDIAPHAVVMVRRGMLPRTSSGKLQRMRARETYLDGTLVATR